MHSSDWQAEFPWPSEHLQLPAADGSSYRYAYIDQGQGDAPILAVHGNPTWSFYWRRLVHHFAPHRRVIAVDHLGCGRSDKPQHYDYCLQSHRDNLLRLIESLDLRRITLVVHDWGGAIGLGAAVLQPDRFERLVVTNTGAFPPPYLPWRIAVCRWPLVGPVAVRGFNAFARAAVSMATARYRRLPTAAAAGLLAPYDSWDHRVAINAFVQDIPMRPAHRTYELLQQIEIALPTLASKPILLVWGMLDWCFRSECLHRLQSHWPGATTQPLDDVGHYVMEDAPNETLAAIDRFLSEPTSVNAALPKPS